MKKIGKVVRWSGGRVVSKGIYATEGSFIEVEQSHSHLHLSSIDEVKQ
ncbi:hypothetical protein [Alkalibaculum bacchi]|nr:hypothetical protein [Alkalibaculum bacchi]